MAKTRRRFRKAESTKRQINWKRLSPKTRDRILRKHKKTYDTYWKKANRQKQRLYVSRSTTRRFIRKQASRDDLNNVIALAKERLDNLNH